MPVPHAPSSPLSDLPASGAGEGAGEGEPCAATDDLAAFIETWSRMVFSTALRRLGDEEGAKEVAQNVFVTAYRKLDLLKTVKHPAAWFHRATMLESSNYLRAERRRQRHLEKWAATQSFVPGGDDTAVPDEWRGHLDEALDALGGGDRELVLGRYFEERSFQELADHRGSTPDAVRVRLTRILEKLGTVLKRRGVAVSATAVGGILTSQWTQAAPAGWGATVAAAAGTAQAVAPWPSFLTSIKSAKSLSIAALTLLCSIAAVRPVFVRVSDLKEKLAVPRASFLAIQNSAPGLRGGAGPEDADVEPAGPVSGSEFFNAMRESPPPRGIMDTHQSSLDPRLDSMSVAELKKLLLEVDALQGGSWVKKWIRSSIVSRTLGRKDPETALKEAIRLRLNDTVFRVVAEQWVLRGGKDAVEKILKMLENPDIFSAALVGANPAGGMRQGLAGALVELDRAAAVQLCREAAGKPAAAHYMRGMAYALARNEDLDTIFELYAGVPPGVSRMQVLRELAVRMFFSSTDAGPLVRFVNDSRFPQDIRKDVILKTCLQINALGQDSYSVNALLMIGATSKREEKAATWAAWLREANPPHEVYRTSPSELEAEADHVLEEVLLEAGPLDPAAARKWLVMVRDPKLRASIAENLNSATP